MPGTRGLNDRKSIPGAGGGREVLEGWDGEAREIVGYALKTAAEVSNVLNLWIPYKRDKNSPGEI